MIEYLKSASCRVRNRRISFERTYQKQLSEATSTNLQFSIFNSQYRLVRVKLPQSNVLTFQTPHKNFHPLKTKFQQLHIIRFQFLEKRGFYLVPF